MSEEVTANLRAFVATRAYHVCEYCLIHENDTFWGCQLDHVVSRKHGGGSESENLAWACAVCNNHKGSDLGSLAGDPLRLVRFFHPRTDAWPEYFQLIHVRIEALNDIGAVTEKVLQLNHASRVLERSTLAGVGRYPTVEALARMKE